MQEPGEGARRLRAATMFHEDLMRLPTILAASALLAACGQSNKEQLQDAANQSDPAAAQVLNDAANSDMPPQEALQEAGNAAAAGEPSENMTGNNQ